MYIHAMHACILWEYAILVDMIVILSHGMIESCIWGLPWYVQSPHYVSFQFHKSICLLMILKRNTVHIMPLNITLFQNPEQLVYVVVLLTF